MGARSIKELCEGKGITIEELSQKVGFDVVEFEYRSKNETIETDPKMPHIRHITYQGIGLKEALKICEVLEIQMSDLLSSI